MISSPHFAAIGPLDPTSPWPQGQDQTDMAIKNIFLPAAQWHGLVKGKIVPLGTFWSSKPKPPTPRKPQILSI